jgi:hypothetical protein
MAGEAGRFARERQSAFPRWLPAATLGLIAVLSPLRYRLLLAGLAIGYLLLYLYSLQHIVYLPQTDLSTGYGVPSLQLVEEWPAKLWRLRAPMTWEPIGAIFLSRHLMVLIAVPNLLIGAALAALVGANLTVALYGMFAAVSRPGRGPGKSGSLVSFLSALPGLLGGFACCVPVFLLALGSLAAGLTVGFIAVQPYLVPVAAALLIANLLWSARRLVVIGCVIPSSRLPA